MTDEQLRNLRILAERAANVFWWLDVIAEDLDKTEATPAKDFVEAANPGLILEMADTIANLRQENAQLNAQADWLAGALMCASSYREEIKVGKTFLLRNGISINAANGEQVIIQFNHGEVEIYTKKPEAKK